MKSFLYRFFKKISNKIFSRWIILLVDVIVVIFSSILVHLLLYNFYKVSDYSSFILNNTIVICVASIIGFLIAGTYRSIVRHSDIRDFLKIIGALLIASVLEVGAFLYFCCLAQPNHKIELSLTLIFIVNVVALVLLLFLRLFIKFTFHYFTKNNNDTNQTNILIYGAGDAGRVTQKVINNAKEQSNLRIMGFVDASPTLQGKSINGVRIYSPSELNNDLIKRLKIEEIIFAVLNISEKDRVAILNDLVDLNNVKVKEIPPLGNWLDKKLPFSQIQEIKINDLLERKEINLNLEEFEAFIKDKVIFVTGAAGSIGSEIVRQISNFSPEQVVLIDQAETPLHEVELEIFKKNPDFYKKIDFQIASVSDKVMMSRIFETYKPDIVYHAAAYKHVPMMERNPISAVTANILGTYTTASLAKEHNCDKFIMISTDKAVNPTNFMGATKRTAEIICQGLNNDPENKTKFIITRFGNVLGSNDSVIHLFRKQIKSGGPVTVTHKDIERYFMTIPEACQLVLQASAFGEGGNIFMFDMGKPVKIRDLAHKMIKLSGHTPNVDIDIIYTGLRPGEKISEEMLMKDENLVETPNEKIKLANLAIVEYRAVGEIMDNIYEAYKKFDAYQIVKQIKIIVPEYKSNNSIFEKIDKELELEKGNKV
jgi:FlaA1/EpsC-like NDP-sugar epimerase